jgi:insulysin
MIKDAQELHFGNICYLWEQKMDKRKLLSLIHKSGGVSNAHTTEKFTTYYFEVLNKYFIKTMDIFAEFFIDPLLSDNAVEREINAVNSEYMKNLPIESEKVIDVLKDIADVKNHPFHNFGCGNKETLSKHNIKEILKNFYDKYYSSNIMKLVVLSNIEMDVMEKKIKKIFSKIPNKNIDLPYKFNNVSNYGPFTKGKQLISTQ